MFSVEHDSEEDTKMRVLDALKRCGWGLDRMRMEYSLASDRYRIVPQENKTECIKSSRTRPDILLFHSSFVPIAVIEVKRFSFADSEGIDQAKQYAAALHLPFALSSSGHGFVEYNMLTGVQREFTLDQFPTPDDLWRRYCKALGTDSDDSATVSSLDDAPYYTSSRGKSPRYYQMVAINEVVNAILLKKQKRLLLVMATGTGKTYTAFQIVWRLLHSGTVHRVLYLADRNQLIDQAILGDFTPLKDDVHKLEGGKVNKYYKVYFGLYQQLKNAHSSSSEAGSTDESENGVADMDLYKQFAPDFFDLVIVDECHRGSAREDSSWREILEYFSSAVQLGLTATPNRKDGADNLDYFGEPVFSYSLKQGINDGYLAPYQVVRVHLDKDDTGWMPEEGERDDNGQPLPQRLFKLSDYDRTLILKSRIKVVAEYINDFLQHYGPYSKTIVFCVTQRHALMMRDELRALNATMMRKNSNYIVRMTADDKEGQSLYHDFCSTNEIFPVVVTTSKLLTTGADTQCVKLIVIDTTIKSMIEFKQIIGRGTRLVPKEGKTYFTILDFRGVSALFYDPEFDGEPDNVKEVEITNQLSGQSSGAGVGSDAKRDNQDKQPSEAETQDGAGTGTDTGQHKKREVFEVSNVEVTFTGSTVSYLDEQGNLIKTTLELYTKEQIVENFATAEEFAESWKQAESKGDFIKKLDERGVKLNYIRDQLGIADVDDFDLLAHMGYGRALRSRRERAAAVRSGVFLKRYDDKQRQILDAMLDVYVRLGVSEIEGVPVLRKDDFTKFGKTQKIINNCFNGDKRMFMQALMSLKASLYADC